MSLIHWDTTLLVYWPEAHPTFGSQTKEVWDKYYKRGAREKAAEAREMFEQPEIRLLPLSVDVAERYAQIRADQHLNPADAIHLAAASVASANLFLTNDSAISKLTVPGIDFVAGLNVNLF